MTERELYSPITNCRLCESDELTKVLDLGTMALSGIFPASRDEYVPAGPLELLQCTACGLAQLAHNYDPRLLYGDNYGYRSGLNISMVRHLHSKVAQIEKQIRLDPGDIVIDIGSNDGTLLGGYKARGIRRIGIDATGLKFLQYYPGGTEIITEFFSVESIKRSIGDRKASVITSIAMFYDLEHPMEFVRGIAELLEPHGLWVLEQSYLPQMIEARSYDTICHEHLEYYTLKQIDHVVKSAGLKVVGLEFNGVNGGSFSVTVAHKDGPYRVGDEIVNATLSMERAKWYDTPRPFDALRDAMVRSRRDLRAILEMIKRDGRKVLGYGASTKGNVLLQYCGIDESLLPFIAEVNEDKFGCFTPGTRIPIIPEAEARAMKPDFFLVLPWHFRETIVKKERQFLDNGGALIFPLPSLSTVVRNGNE